MVFVVLSLEAIGFSKYEARAYSALVKHPQLNGYELAKRTGIPRANIYTVLGKLVERGAVLRHQRDDGPRYTAVDPEQLLGEMETGHLQALDQARRDLAKLSPSEDSQPVFNLHGEEWLGQARRLIAGAEESLLIAIQPPEAATLTEALRAAQERGVPITTLCLSDCPTDCGHCQGAVHRHGFQCGDEGRQLLLLADDRQVLMARFEGARTDAVLSRQPLLTQLASRYIHQSLALGVLGRELAGRGESFLSTAGRQLLDRLVPKGNFIDWLKSVSGSAA